MRKKNIQRLVIAAVLLIVLPFVISQFMLECLTKLFAMDPDQASTISLQLCSVQIHTYSRQLFHD